MIFIVDRSEDLAVFPDKIPEILILSILYKESPVRKLLRFFPIFFLIYRITVDAEKTHTIIDLRIRHQEDIITNIKVAVVVDLRKHILARGSVIYMVSSAKEITRHDISFVHDRIEAVKHVRIHLQLLSGRSLPGFRIIREDRDPVTFNTVEIYLPVHFVQRIIKKSRKHRAIAGDNADPVVKILRLRISHILPYNVTTVR